MKKITVSVEESGPNDPKEERVILLKYEKEKGQWVGLYQGRPMGPWFSNTEAMAAANLLRGTLERQGFSVAIQVV